MALCCCRRLTDYSQRPTSWDWNVTTSSVLASLSCSRRDLHHSRTSVMQFWSCSSILYGHLWAWSEHTAACQMWWRNWYCCMVLMTSSVYMRRIQEVLIQILAGHYCLQHTSQIQHRRTWTSVSVHWYTIWTSSVRRHALIANRFSSTSISNSWSTVSKQRKSSSTSAVTWPLSIARVPSHCAEYTQPFQSNGRDTTLIRAWKCLKIERKITKKNQEESENKCNLNSWRLTPCNSPV